ncbi:MAG TPA: AbrB/MazE/SpoVT family DNA-binding domain-containing protein [Terracidiphilus sp.]|nr:AbrB/MazE/SpoVT family DNA-binding domain-containing protein [Terracidiphilus sp.]
MSAATLDHCQRRGICLGARTGIGLVETSFQAALSLLLLKCKERFVIMEATLSSKGQATIPKAVRERLQIKPGDRFKFFFHPDGVIILPKIPTERLKGSVPRMARSVSNKDIDKAIEAGATARFRRKK